MKRGLAAAGVCALAVLVAAMFIAPRFARGKVRSFAADRGFVLSGEIAVTPSALRVGSVAFESNGVVVECEGVRVEQSPLRFARERSADLVVVERCALLPAEHGSDDPGTDEPAAGENDPEGTSPMAQALETMRSIDIDVAEVRIERVDFGPLVRAERAFAGIARSVVVTRVGTDNPSVRAVLELSAPLEWRGTVEAAVADNTVTFSSSEPIEHEAITVGPLAGSLSVGGELTLTGLEVSHRELGQVSATSFTVLDGDVSLEGVRLSATQTAWLVEAAGFAPESAPDDEDRVPPDPEEDGGPEPSDDDLPPAYATTFLQALGEVPARLFALRQEFGERVAELAIQVDLSNTSLSDIGPCGSLELSTTTLSASGLSVTGLCDGQSISVTMPASPTAPIRLETTDIDVGRLFAAGSHEPDPSLRGSAASGLVDITATIAASPTSMDVGGSIHTRDLGFEHPAISAERIAGITAGVNFTATVRTGAGTSLRFGARGRMGSIRFDGSVEAEPDGETWDVTAEGGLAEPAPCADVWAIIPRGLVPRLADANVEFEGHAQPRLRANYRVGEPASVDLRQEGFMGSCRVTGIDPDFDPQLLASDNYVHTVTEGVTRPLRVGPGSSSFVRIDSLPAYVPALMYLSEEIAFFDNPGFSMMLMRRAIRMNIREGRYVYGGSTVTQQLVKNLFFERAKTLSRKLEEAIVVWAMEAALTKERILELYINCIEFAPDVYGIRAASLHYFGKEPAELTPMEAAFLAALKPAPGRGNYYRNRGHSPETGWWQERIEVLLTRLVEYGGYIDAREVAHYAPFVIAFPTSARYDEQDFRPVPRPKGAIVETFDEARARMRR